MRPVVADARFADEIAKGFGAAKAARTMDGEAHPWVAPEAALVWPVGSRRLRFLVARNNFRAAEMIASGVVSAAVTILVTP